MYLLAALTRTISASEDADANLNFHSLGTSSSSVQLLINGVEDVLPVDMSNSQTKWTGFKGRRRHRIGHGLDDLSAIASTMHSMDARTKLAKTIDQAIKASDKSVAQLAKLVNVDSSSISRWRRDAQRCPPSRTKDLAKALGLDPQREKELTELAMQAESEGKDDQRAFRSTTIRYDLDDVKAEIQRLSDEVRLLKTLLDTHQHGPTAG